jgi:hypothetical protein
MNDQMTPWLYPEPSQSYHAQAGHYTQGKYLSSHLLATFKKSPYLYWLKAMRLTLDRDSDAYAIGRAAHTLILEGEGAYYREYAVGGPTNPKTGLPFGKSTKAFAEWEAEQGKPVLAVEDHNLVCAMHAAVLEHPVAGGLLSAGGVAEHVCRAYSDGIYMQARPDYWHTEHGLVDLKTCEDLDRFENDARRYGYLHQVAYYAYVISLAKNIPMLDIPARIVAVEKQPPHRAGVWIVADIEVAHAENIAAIGRMQGCVASNRWPTGYELPRVLTM